MRCLIGVVWLAECDSRRKRHIWAEIIGFRSAMLYSTSARQSVVETGSRQASRRCCTWMRRS